MESQKLSGQICFSKGKQSCFAAQRSGNSGVSRQLDFAFRSLSAQLSSMFGFQNLLQASKHPVKINVGSELYLYSNN